MRRTDEHGLTDQQRRFCDLYLIELNGTKAYMEAGFRVKSKAVARAAAARLLTNPRVEAYLAARKVAIQEKLEITQERIQREIAAVAFFDIRQLFGRDGNILPIQDLPRDVAAGLAGMDVIEEFDAAVAKEKGDGDGARALLGFTKKVKLRNKLEALKLLGLDLGMFKQKHEHTGKDGAPITIEGIAEMLTSINGADTGIGPSRSRALG